MTKSENSNKDETDANTTTTNKAAAAAASTKAVSTLDEKANTTTTTKKRRPYVPEEPIDSLFFVGGDTKVHMGKMEPCRDLGLPAFLLVMGILMTYSMVGIGKSTAAGRHNQKSWDQQMVDIVGRKIKLGFDRRGGSTAEHCSTLFYAKSSIPGAGYSVFAGQAYAVGDIVFPEGDFLPTALHPSNGDSSISTSLMIQQHAYLLKFHHLLNNLEGNSFATHDALSDSSTAIDYSLRASKPIHPGDELLLPPHLHPKAHLYLHDSNYFDKIPTEQDFDVAEAILKDEIFRFRFVRGHKQPKGNEIEKTLNLLYQTVYRFNSNAARLLPKKKRILDEWAKKLESPTTPFAVNVTEPKSYAGLEMNARCFSYASDKVASSKDDTPQSTSGIVATRDFQEGDIVFPVPLLLLPTNNGPSCENDNAETGQCSSHTVVMNTEWSTSRCFGHDDLPFLLCPLSSADRMACSPGTGTTVENAEIADARKGPNVKLQWGKANAGNKNSHESSAEEVVKLYTTQLSLELIALQDIQEGEELVVHLEASSTDAYRRLPDDIIPDAWKVERH